MKKTIFRIAIVAVAVVLLAALVLVCFGMRQGIRFSEARYIETAYGHMLLLDNSPVSMSGKDGLFDGLTTGDKVLVAHGLIAESYPGQAKAYLCIKLDNGEIQNIPEDVIASLAQMGWLPEYLLKDENQAITIALNYMGMDEDDCIRVTAKQNTTDGGWTVLYYAYNEEMQYTEYTVVELAPDGSVIEHYSGVDE